jgi:uncharacterized protein YndB with AHSA1/START domain
MQLHDWTKFHLRIPVNTDVETVYKAWTTQEGLENWFLRKAAFTDKNGVARKINSSIQVNDTYEWLWHGWGDEVMEKGSVLQMNGKNFLKFSFGKAGNVSVTINNEGEESLVELVQSEIPTDESSQINFHLGCTKGWIFYLTNLKSILEGGIDLRNRKEALKDVINS